MEPAEASGVRGEMQIVWTKHAEERQQQWEVRLGITKEEVEAVVTNPQQVILEDDVRVAQVTPFPPEEFVFNEPLSTQ
jgi:hypothetical protein